MQPRQTTTSNRASRRLLAACLVLGGLLLALPAQAQKTYKVHNIDVGQGSATLVQTVGGKNILFDTGWDFAGDRLTGYLKKIGVRKIDALVISHRHMDHIGGVQKLSEKLPVGKVIGPWAKDAIPKGAMVHLGHLRRDLGKPNGARNRPLYETATTGKVFDFGKGFVMETLWPRKNASGKRIGDYNEESVAMRVIQKAPKGGAAATFLVGGDLGVNEERWLARRMPGKLKVDWMVANHHGSRGSSQREYMVAADGGYSKFLKALIAGPERADPKVYKTAQKLKELAKGKYASKLLHNIDPLAHNKVPIKAKWLDKLAKDIRQINDSSPNMSGRFAVFSVGPNSYGHPNAIRMAESQLAGFTPITTWANGSVVMERTLGSNGKWKDAWKPTSVSTKGLPTVKTPKWLGQQDPERPYNNDRREANQHWQKNNPQPEVKWTAAWDTSISWRGLSRKLAKGRKDWVEEYVKVKKQAKDGTRPDDGKKPRSTADRAKSIAAGKRKLKAMRYPKKTEWHGLRLGEMRELTKDELERIAIKRENPNRVKAKAVVKGKWVEKPVAPEHPASFSQEDLLHSPGRNVKAGSKGTWKTPYRRKATRAGATTPSTITGRAKKMAAVKKRGSSRLASYSSSLKGRKVASRKKTAGRRKATTAKRKAPAKKKTATARKKTTSRKKTSTASRKKAAAKKKTTTASRKKATSRTSKTSRKKARGLRKYASAVRKTSGRKKATARKRTTSRTSKTARKKTSGRKKVATRKTATTRKASTRTRSLRKGARKTSTRRVSKSRPRTRSKARGASTRSRSSYKRTSSRGRSTRKVASYRTRRK